MMHQRIRDVIKFRGQCRHSLIKRKNKCLSVQSIFKGSNTNQWERKDYSTNSSGTIDHPYREVKKISHKEKVDKSNHIKTVYNLQVQGRIPDNMSSYVKWIFPVVFRIADKPKLMTKDDKYPMV